MFVTVQNALNSAYQALDDKVKGIIMKHPKKTGGKENKLLPATDLAISFCSSTECGALPSNL